jgi:acetate kinase
VPSKGGVTNILVLNCGSSSVKYNLFDMTGEQALGGGLLEKIGQPEPMLAHRWGSETVRRAVEAPDHATGLMRIRELLLDPDGDGESNSGLAAVGHRVVHGAESFVSATLITPEVEQIIEECSSLAPLHNPPNLVGIRAARRFFPDVPHVAVFDTAFHQSMPERAYLYPLPYEFYTERRIRKYGFHGTSHRYVAERAARWLDEEPAAFTGITCHLGNGCSLAAVEHGLSIDTSMGLTPLEGVPMGTRSGDIDPAIIFFLAEQGGMSLAEINQVLNRRSGLLGLSGVSNDLREIQQAAAQDNHRAEMALEVYAYRVRKYIGAYLAALGGAQAVVFTGGIGEHGDQMRARILQDLRGLGIWLDAERNRQCRGTEGEITAVGSPIKALVIPTNEELMIARDTWEVARGLSGL